MIWLPILPKNERCYCLNIPMTLEREVSWRASLERLNPDVGYIRQNCALICPEVNQAISNDRTMRRLTNGWIITESLL